MSEKVTEKPKTQGHAVTRVKFVSPVKLGTNEYSMWTPERVPGFRCQASSVGMVFQGADLSYDYVIPYTNISSYEVER